METAAGHRQGQEAEQPLLQRIEGTGEVEGDSDRKQPDGQMNQIRVQWNRVGKIIGTERVGDLVDRRWDGGEQGHDTTPWRIASTTGTVCNP